MSKKRKPAYLLHQPSGQARVRIDGKDHYLGEYDSLESKERYEDLAAEWMMKQGNFDRYLFKVDDLCLLYMAHAKQYYRRKDGSQTAEVSNLQHALKFLIILHGNTRVREFVPLKLKEVRDSMISAGMVRTNINRQIQHIKRVFKWGVENELVQTEFYVALSTVAGLKRYRSDAAESGKSTSYPVSLLVFVMAFIQMHVTCLFIYYGV